MVKYPRLKVSLAPVTWRGMSRSTVYKLINSLQF
jgi:predicted DNA-binding transcriptional regulator AlpA